MPTQVGIGIAKEAGALETGRECARQALSALGSGRSPSLFILFASTAFDPTPLLRGVLSEIGSAPLIGCTTAGEFAGTTVTDGAAAGMAIASDTLRVGTGLGRRLKGNSLSAVSQTLSELRKKPAPPASEFPERTMLVLSDGLAGDGEQLVDNFVLEAGMRCQIAGGAAGDDGKFVQTLVFHRDQAMSDVVAAADIRSKTPLGIGVCHGWCPSQDHMTVTRSQGNVLIELDRMPAIEIYRRFAERIGFTLTPDNTNLFMMSHELGIVLPNNEVKVRAPLRANPDGSIVCASEIPEGKTVSVVQGDKDAIIEASRTAARNALANLGGAEPAAAIVFNCIARKLILGDRFKEEIQAIQSVVGNVPVIGFNTYGEIARVKGQLSGFHNTTDVVCLIPR